MASTTNRKSHPALIRLLCVFMFGHGSLLDSRGHDVIRGMTAIGDGIDRAS
jgi:hypothetical protein